MVKKDGKYGKGKIYEDDIPRRHFFKKVGGMIAAAAIGGEISVFVEDSFASSKLEDKIEMDYGFGIIGDTSEKNVVQLQSVLESCAHYWAAFEHEIKELSFVDLKSSFWTFIHRIIGAAGGAKFGMIMLDSIDDETFMHELAHIYHESVDASFSRKWKNYVDVAYGSLTKKGNILQNKWKNGELFLGKEGFMSPYGSTSLREDVATYQENLYVITKLIKTLHEKNNPVVYEYIHPIFFNFSPKGDLRYQGKVSLLREYGFMDDSDFELVRPVFW